MFLCYFLYFLVATFPRTSVSHHADTTSSHSLNQFAAGFYPSKVFKDYGYGVVQKSTFFSNVENQKIVGSDQDKFVKKHLWDPAQHNGKSSFDYFKNNPEFTKAYFIALNQKIFLGNILPYQEQLANKKSYLKKITIVDADIKKIRSDINNGPIRIEKNKVGDVYLTNDFYKMTQITAKFEGENLVFKAAKLEGRFEFGLDKAGKNIVHLQKPHIEGTITIHKNVELTRFSLAELNNIENGRIQIQDGLKQDFKELKSKPVLLNENHPSYKKLQENVRSQCKSGRKRRSLHIGGSSCGIMVKKNGDVDYISPKDFLESYKKADEYGKKVLAEIATKNKDKLLSNTDNDIETKKLNNLLELEKTKSHVKDLNIIDVAYKVPKSNSKKSDSASILDGTTRKLGEVESNYKISYTKTVNSVANYKAAKAVAHGVSKANSYLSVFFTAKTIVNGIKHNDTTSLAIVGAQLGFSALTDAVVSAGTKYSKHVTKQFTNAINAKDLGKITKLGKAIKTASKVGKAAKVISEVAGPIGIGADIGISAWSMAKSVVRLLNATNKYERNAAIADIVGEAIDITVTIVVSAVSLFPPAAPFAIAAGIVINLVTQLAVALFKAGNEVARINAEVPLLDFEKERVFKSRFFDWFGTRKPDYIDNLVDEKKANDIAVQLSVEILR